MSDLTTIAGLLEDLISEIQGLRSDFNEFTGYNTTKMSDAVSEITGPSGYHLGDIFTAIGSLETAVDLK